MMFKRDIYSKAWSKVWIFGIRFPLPWSFEVDFLMGLVGLVHRGPGIYEDNWKLVWDSRTSHYLNLNQQDKIWNLLKHVQALPRKTLATVKNSAPAFFSSTLHRGCLNGLYIFVALVVPLGCEMWSIDPQKPVKLCDVSTTSVEILFLDTGVLLCLPNFWDVVAEYQAIDFQSKSENEEKYHEFNVASPIRMVKLVLGIIQNYSASKFYLDQEEDTAKRCTTS